MALDKRPWLEGFGARIEDFFMTDVIVDIEALRAYMIDYVGTAMMNGFPAAILDLSEIECMNPCELIKKAEELGIDPSRFSVS